MAEHAAGRRQLGELLLPVSVTPPQGLLQRQRGISAGSAEHGLYPQGETATSSTSLSCIPWPLGFKAEKRRKTQQFILKEKGEQRPLFERHHSEVDPRLLDDTDKTKLFAGVSTLIYRHVMEGQRHACHAAESSVGSSVQNSGRRLASRDFDGSHFFELAHRMGREPCWRRLCCCRRRNRAVMSSPNTVYRLLLGICTIGHFPKELIVLSAIYIERLLDTARVTLTPLNWRPISVVALLIASKMWEDVHPWNIDFAEIIVRASPLMKLHSQVNLYRLEAKFLRGMGWNAAVSGEVYASYYFALLDADKPGTPPYRSRNSNEFSILPTSHSTDFTSGTFVSGIDDMDCSVNFLSESNGHEEDRLDRSNPYIGTFRHAHRSAPPSRQISSRRSSHRGMKKCLSADAAMDERVDEHKRGGGMNKSKSLPAGLPRMAIADWAAAHGTGADNGGTSEDDWFRRTTSG